MVAFEKRLEGSAASLNIYSTREPWSVASGMTCRTQSASLACWLAFADSDLR